MSNPIEDAARAFLTNTPMDDVHDMVKRTHPENTPTGGPSALPGDIDILLGRVERFQKILERAGNAPFAEAAILCGLLRLILPGVDGATLAKAEADIRSHVGIKD